MSKNKSWRRHGPNRDTWSRRSYLVATVGVAALSGCSGDRRNGDGTAAPDERDGEDDENGEEEGRPEGVSAEEFESGPVPDAYLSATSLGGEQRDPDGLRTKSDVSFSEYEDAREMEAHQPGTCCANCVDYIPDKDGDGFGACAEVEGYVGREDWCTIYESLPEPEVPEGMSEDELATAEVPEPYRTASSQVGETRDPENLSSHEDVDLMESVDAIEEGVARPGQSCGNCAEFVPDKNGDTWGACAKVEGYIAAEDWCTIWEHVSEEL